MSGNFRPGRKLLGIRKGVIKKIRSAVQFDAPIFFRQSGNSVDLALIVFTYFKTYDCRRTITALIILKTNYLKNKYYTINTIPLGS